MLYINFSKLENADAVGHTKSFRKLYSRGPDDYAISISPKIRHLGVFWKGTLLHEMVHVELNLAKVKHECGEGKGTSMFNARMLQLAQQGALNGLW